MSIVAVEDTDVDYEATDFLDEQAFAEFVEAHPWEPEPELEHIYEDALGKYVIVDGQRIPVRNGGPREGMKPSEDWNEARRIVRGVESGQMRPGGVLLGFRTLLSGPWANWTVYRTLGHWYDLVWAAGAFCGAAPAALWVANGHHGWIWTWCAGWVGWSLLCQVPAESDRKIRIRRALADAS